MSHVTVSYSCDLIDLISRNCWLYIPQFDFLIVNFLTSTCFRFYSVAEIDLLYLINYLIGFLMKWSV